MQLHVNNSKMMHDEAANQEIEKKVVAAFKIFDHENDNSIDIRELWTNCEVFFRDVGAVIRYLGCCPSEADLGVIIEEMQDDESPFVRLEKFVPIACKLVEDGTHRGAKYHHILQACQLMDPANQGFFTKQQLKQWITQSGEEFSEEEWEELTKTLNPTDENIDYREWITNLVENA